VGYVKTPEEIERIERELSAPRWSGEWLSIQFLTESTTLERLLPPPLAPGPEPIATVSVGRWQSNCLGDFSGGVLNLAARHGDVAGTYVLALYMDREPPVTFGRDVFGEPKKLATSGLFRDRDQVHAWVERHGVRLIDLRAEVGPDQGPSRFERSTFNYKARTATGGRGLEEDAILTRTRFDVELRSQCTGLGTVLLGHGVHDPLDEVEVLEVRRAIYGEDESAARCAAVATLPARDFLPYHYGRQDDWLALNTAPIGSPVAV
jgi:acetoacetate decarboxylase